MQNRMVKVSHISLGVLISIGLIACGGGGSDDSAASNNSGGETSAGDGAGTGGCVSFPRPVVGQKVKFEFKNEDAELVSTIERTFTAVSDTSVTETVTIEIAGLGDIELPFGEDGIEIPDLGDIDLGDFGIGGIDLGDDVDDLPALSESTYTENFTIANNYRDITSSSTATLGLTTTTSYAPYQRVPVDKVCEGQTWTTTYTESSTPGGVSQHTQTYVVEAVNIPKSSTAGSFNTFRVHSVQGDTEGKTWVDIATGVAVFSEYKDLGTSDTPGTIDLIEMN